MPCLLWGKSACGAGLLAWPEALTGCPAPAALVKGPVTGTDGVLAGELGHLGSSPRPAQEAAGPCASMWQVCTHALN